nr:unnamed protein product [Digitaria exilis]
MGYLPALGGKAAHLVSDLATVILNPVSEREQQRHHPSHLPEGTEVNGTLFGDEDFDKNSETPDGPDTSSFRAFLMSFVSSSTSSKDSMETIPEHNLDVEYPTLTPVGKASSGRKGLLSRGKHSIGRIISKAGLILGGMEYRCLLCIEGAGFVLATRFCLLYNLVTDIHMIICAALLPQIVGDRRGAVFGGLVEAPLQPIIKRKYQGTNDCFVFTNVEGRSVICRPTGANNYFTFCSTDYLAMGGGGHFALYLDGDLLNGSSSTSETFNNPCLSHTPEFKIKDVELWGFVNASNYEEMLTICRTEKQGIWNL